MTPPRRKAVAVVLALVAPLVIWAVHLATLYGVHGAVCERQDAGVPLAEPAVLLPAIVAATAVALALLAALIAARRFVREAAASPRDGVFYARALVALALLSALAVAWSGTAALMLEVCSTLR